jgi:hypothetical protein
MHSRQPAIREAFTRGALQIKFPGHSRSLLPFGQIGSGPNRWAARTVLCSNTTVKKCNKVCTGLGPCCVHQR